ncbi:MAG: hypothetical protein CVU16_06345 [Betaproteobacteria bacterium HGW-Betaproteobacteria-10]|nr:MAG: hypothetical protein CVU16_06345 [Betaproteobacteria bacterium HGW-Betaproteobacteria-10]
MKQRDLLIAGASLALASTLLWASLTPEHSDAYIFPILWTALMLVVAALLLLQASNRPPAARPRALPWRRLLPAMIIAGFYLTSFETVGFYASTWLAFFALTSQFGQRRKDWWLQGQRLAISLAFVGGLYALFTGLLAVQAPHGWLI